ncbi:MAG TPA: DUF4258 domain-containing protein [Solirubrobacterales bacterium]|nr:DUF4258 domain-containing protein [Solirubrobacterales bacterium]
MRFSRHAKNRMRRDGIAEKIVEAIAAMPDARRVDGRGNPIAIGRDERGRPIEIVVALDDLDYVITVIARRKQR